MTTEYMQAARSALKRRLDHLEDARRRGIHTDEECAKLRQLIVAEQEQAWECKLDQ